MTQNDIIFIRIIDQNGKNKKYLNVQSKYFELFTSYELGFKKNMFIFFSLEKKDLSGNFIRLLVK